MTHYQSERTHGCRVSDSWSYRGLKTVVLENETIRVLVLADKGADVYSFVHKPTDTDFIWRSPWGVRDPRKFLSTTGAPPSVWLDVYEGGWQTVVPHGGYPSTVAGAENGLHGEVNTMPWDAKIVEDSPERVAVKFWVRGQRTPFTAEKTLSIEAGSGTLAIDETVTNQGEEPADCVWLEHIALGAPFLSTACRLDVSPSTVLNHESKVEPNSKLEPGSRGTWPHTRAIDGRDADLRRMRAKDTRAVDMAYMTDMAEGWYAVTNENLEVGFALTFPKDVFRYLWYWQSSGAFGYPWYGRTYNVGLEPCTSYDNNGLAQAVRNGTARHFAAGECVSATIRATAFTGRGEVKRVTPEGRVER